MSRTYDDQVIQYISTTYAPEDALLQTIRAEGERRVPGMQVNAVEGKLLATFVKLSGTKRILELGTFMGYSTLWMARAVGEHGEVITCERNSEHAKQARTFFDEDTAGKKMTIREGDALAIIHALAKEKRDPFDLVFIDAEKKSYHEYLLAIEPMLRPGSLVIADNVLLFGHMVGEPKQKISAAAIAAMQQCNQRLADPTLYHAVMIPTQEGLTVAVKV